MMNIQKLQKGLLDWFWLDSNQLKAYSSIENTSIKLFEQYFPNLDVIKAKYEIFYPLLKYGVLEFYGNKKFGLSPSSALFTDTHILLINIPLNRKNSHHTLYDYCNSNLGIEVLKNSPTSIADLKKLNIPHSKFILSMCLIRIASFESIIYNWVDDKVIDSNNFYLFNDNYKWIKSKFNYKKGVYKKSSENYAQRVVKLSEYNWKIIPSRDYNIDAFNIAVIYSQIQNNWDIGLKYYEMENKLVISNNYFPIIIERLLFINTLLELNENINVFNRQYFIKKTDFNILNKLFAYKIDSK